MAGVLALLARWRADRGLLALLVVVVALTAGMVGAVPRLLDQLALASLDAALSEARPDRVGLAASTVQPFDVTRPAAALDRANAAAATLDDDLDPELASALGEPTVVVDSVRYDLRPLPGQAPDALERKLTIRLQDRVQDHLTLVEGSLPDGATTTVEVDLGAASPVELDVHQFAATAETAAGLGLRVGERRLGAPDPTGPILGRLVVPPTAPVVLELSGIVELTAVEEPVWFGDPRLHRPSRFDTNVGTTIFGVGVLPSDAAGDFPDGRDDRVAGVAVRWQLDRAGLLGADVGAVQAAALQLRTSAPLELEEPRWTTGLDAVLATEAARRATAVEVLGLGAVSVVGVASALLVAVAALLAARRREAFALVRGRGASRAQLVAATVAELGLVVAVGLVLASAVLVLALPGDGGLVAVVVVGLLALTVLVAGGLRDVRRRLGALLAERGRTVPARPRRHVLDGLLVLVAVVAVMALQRRGIAVDGAIDPLVIAAPVLVAAAIAVVTARLVLLPLRAAEAAARRGRGLAVPLGLARAARGPGAGVVVVLLVLGVGVAGLAAAIHRTLVTGQERAAQDQVGADVRVDATPLASLQPDWAVPPGATVADVSLLTRASAVSDTGAHRVDLLLVDPEDLAALGLQAPLRELGWDGVGAAPVLVAGDLRGIGSPAVGDALTLAVGTDRVAARVVGFDHRLLGRDAERDGAFVVVDREAVTAATGLDPGVTTRLVRTNDAVAVEASALAADPDATVLVRERIEAALEAAPLGRGVRIGYLVAAAAAVAATAAALLMALAAAAPQRRRQAAVLAAVGTPRRAIRSALLAEVLPVVAGAAAVGVALAAVVSLLLGGQLDLSPFTGTVDATGLALPHPAVAVALVAAAVTLAAVGAIITLGRVDPGALLREGDG